MTDLIREFIVKAIQKKSRLPLDCDVDAFNYIDTGYIDSMEIIKFILELENEFNIDISSKEVESKEFRTIGGLIGIVAAKVKAD